jgi:hypothetical protein
MEPRTKTNFDDYLNIAEGGHSKTASAKVENKGDEPTMLQKIAQELGNSEGSEKTAAAPTAEGENSPAASSVAGAAEPVVGATEGVTVPQTNISGGNQAEVEAGEKPAATKTNEGLAISAGDDKVTDANNLHKTPEAVAAAAEYGGGDEGSAATPSPEKDGQMPDQATGGYGGQHEKMAEADAIGVRIATSFQNEIEKQAEARDYSEALEILGERDLLKGYDIKDAGIDKTASVKTNCLEKLANKQPLSRSEIIGAAVETLDMEKEAELAAEQGREDAQNLVAAVSQEVEKTATANTEQEKIAAALKDPEVVAAVSLLKGKGIIPNS